MFSVRVLLLNQVRCGLLYQSTPRINFPELACVQKATVCSRKYEIQKARRVEKRLQKLLKKKKKDPSFDPISITQLVHMVTNDPAQTKRGREMVSEKSIKLKTYNTLLHQSIDGIIFEDLEELQLSILGVRLTGDLSMCRVYWQASDNYEENQKIQDFLDSYAGKLRFKLINLRVLGKIPKVVFLQEKSAAKRSEVERLLALADIPPDDTVEENVEPITSTGELEPVLGLDQTEIKQQIERMKKHWSKSEDNRHTEDSIDKFRSSIKRRKKGREKALYSVDGDLFDDSKIGEDEISNDSDDE